MDILGSHCQAFFDLFITTIVIKWRFHYEYRIIMHTIEIRLYTIRNQILILKVLTTLIGTILSSLSLNQFLIYI